MTINDIKKHIFILLDEDPTKTTAFARDIISKAPTLCDLAQRELLNKSRYKKIHTINHTYDTDYKEYKTYQMPSDFDGINYIVNTSLNGFKKDLFYIVNKTLYVKNFYDADYDVIYTPILTELISMDDEFTIEGNIVYDGIPYFVAYNLLLSTDSSRAGLMLQKWQERLEDFRRTQDKTSEEPIINVYGDIYG